MIALIGRPNVGKSSLFNRICGNSDAIVHDLPGTTRDRKLGTTEWGKSFLTILDTGGVAIGPDDSFQSAINEQVDTALNQSDAVIFMVDGREGIHHADRDLAVMLRKFSSKVILAVNKIDQPGLENLVSEFFALGFKSVFPLSASTGYGTGELMDYLAENFAENLKESKVSNSPKVAIVGKPNVGKSTFLNVLTGEQRTIESPVAGTTRDSIYTEYRSFGLDCVLIDTAGMVKNAKLKSEDLLFYSQLRTIKAIKESDVCILMIDANAGISHHDLWIFNLIIENGKGVIICANKWDLAERDNQAAALKEKEILGRLSPFSDVNVIFTSNKSKAGLLKAVGRAIEIAHHRKDKLSTGKLNDKVLPVLKTTPPPMFKGKAVSIKYLQQAVTEKLIVLVYCNLPQYVKEPYARFAENTIRKEFDLKGIPMQVFFRKSG